METPGTMFQALALLGAKTLEVQLLEDTLTNATQQIERMTNDLNDAQARVPELEALILTMSGTIEELQARLTIKVESAKKPPAKPRRAVRK